VIFHAHSVQPVGETRSFVSRRVVIIISLVAVLPHRMACSFDRPLDSNRVSDGEELHYPGLHGVINLLPLMTMVIPASDMMNPQTWSAPCPPTWSS